MKTKNFWLMGMLAMALVFGMMVVGCYGEDGLEEMGPYPQEIRMSASSNAGWPYSFYEELTGECELTFEPYVSGDSAYWDGQLAKISIDDLSWLKASDISLELYNANGRTVTITSIEKTQSGSKVIVKLNLTRSAPYGYASDVKDSGTATISIELPNSFTSKYDAVEWGNRTFKF